MKADSTTSSLQLRHLRQRHPALPTTEQDEIKQLDTLNLRSNIGITPFTIARDGLATGRKQHERFDNNVLREHIACFLVNTNASLSVVENPSFQSLIQYCNPSANTISRRTATRDIVTLYNKLFPQIQAMLQDLTTKYRGKISITFDAWTSTT